MDTYREFIEAYVRWLEAGKNLPLGGWMPPPRPEIDASAPVAMLFSPHPDDEVLTGVLPLRLLRESSWRVINVAVTLGSDREQRPVRRREVEATCANLGFGLEIPFHEGLSNIRMDSRRSDPEAWLKAVDSIASLLDHHKPRVIFIPHATDAHQTHKGVHALLLHALIRLGRGFVCYCVETEFWSPHDQPNLMVETSPRDLADLLAALSFHASQLRRNPYHIRLPGWLSDNVRRGSELILGPGSEAVPYPFAMLYRLARWSDGAYHEASPPQPLYSRSDLVEGLFPGLVLRPREK